MGARVLAPGEMFPAGVPGYVTRHVALRSGIRVRVVELGPDGGARVLLLHGWACSVFDFRSMLPALAAAGFRAIAVDLAGHGLSDKPQDPALYTTPAMVAHAIDVMDALGLRRVALCGHSMGGAIALRAALEHPARVSRVVLLNPSGFGTIPLVPLARVLTPPIVTPWLHLIVTRLTIRLILHVVYGPRGRLSERDIDEYEAPVKLPGFVPAMRHLVHGFDWRRLRDPDVSALEVPALLILGERDRVVARLPFLRRPLLPASAESRTIVIRRGGHIVQEEAPEEVNPAVVNFLREDRG